MLLHLSKEITHLYCSAFRCCLCTHIVWTATYQFCQATPRRAIDIQLENGRNEETHFTGQARVASARLYLQ